MDLAVMVHESENAAPTLLLSQELGRQGAVVARKTSVGAALAVERRAAILRVVPHPDLDACGFEGKHPAYNVTWAIPALCHAKPPLKLPATPEEAAALWRYCPGCHESLAPIGQQLHLKWWDVTEPVTLRAEEVPAAVRVERADAEPLPDQDLPASQAEAAERGLAAPDQERRAHLRRVAVWTDQSPHIYDWPTITARLLAIGEREAAPWADLSAEQRVSLVGAHRHLQLAGLAATERILRRLMHEAADTQQSGPVRLSALSGVSRKTVPSWVTEGANRRSPGTTEEPPY
ncbi:hypothetical protein [Streptomyces sp. NPDC058371]|uniref:hypothetical protein n=1 Tax=Streptomyces sp. NPDC058371 TaxID=3346463 RepID=UPI003653E4FB